MNYIIARRLYRNRATGATSPHLHEVVGDRVTVRAIAITRRHWWRGTPFEEVENLPASESAAAWWSEIEPRSDGSLTAIFDAICQVIEAVWDRDKFHIIFHSSGYDSRILSAAIKRLVRMHGKSWLGGGLLFLGNRWEGSCTREILKRQGWKSNTVAIYDEGRDEDHFMPWVDFDNFWYTAAAPISLPGNLWWYLPDWAQNKGLIPADDECQAFSGYWADETWKQWASVGAGGWLKIYPQHCQHAQAAFRFKLPMEFPMVAPGVLQWVTPALGVDGNTLRKKVANFACPEAARVPHQRKHDRQHPVSRRLRKYCGDTFRSSWYGKNVQRDWSAPATSELDTAWLRWSVASLCEELRRRGVDVRM